MARVVMSFTLDSQKDKHILHYLEGLPKGARSQTIRNALDTEIRGAGVTLGDVYQAVKALECRIGIGSLLLQTGTQESNPHEPEDEPADIAANLDGLGL
jgi:hypothetical protein